MKYFILTLLLITFSHLVIGQGEVAQLVNDGNALHNKGDYASAIEKYDAALLLEPNHGGAMYEKSYSLMELKRYDEALKIIKKILKEFKDPMIRKLAYVNYGTILDYTGNKANSIKIYEEGIKEFPLFYLLYFNKGVTESGIGNKEDAITSFKNAVTRNPQHASSHNALGIIMGEGNRIPGILSKFVFLLLEPTGERAIQNLKQLYALIMKGIDQQEDKNVVTSLHPSVLRKEKIKEDDFSAAELKHSLSAANAPDSLKTMTEPVKILLHQLTTLIGIIDETDKQGNGFYKSFYVPFIIEMNKKNIVTAACYFALTCSGNEAILDWQYKNLDKLDDFYGWMNGYKWVTE